MCLCEIFYGVNLTFFEFGNIESEHFHAINIYIFQNAILFNVGLVSCKVS